MKNGEVTADLFDRKRTATFEQTRAAVFDQASAFENLWQNIRQTKVATAKGRKCAPEPHHKQTAYRHYRRKVRSFADDTRCLAALGEYRTSDRVKAGYVQDAGTFLNQFEEWIPEAQEATMGEVDEETRKREAAEFHRPRVEQFIAEHGDPSRSASARALFNEWAGSAGDGGIFAAWKCSPTHDFWDMWRELVGE